MPWELVNTSTLLITVRAVMRRIFGAETSNAVLCGAENTTKTPKHPEEAAAAGARRRSPSLRCLEVSMVITNPSHEPWKKHPAVGREEGCGLGARGTMPELPQEANLLAGVAACAVAGTQQGCRVLVGVAPYGNVPAVLIACPVADINRPRRWCKEISGA